MGETGPGEETFGPTAVRAVRPRRSPPAVAALGLTLLITASLPGYGGHMALRTDDRGTAADRRAPRGLLAVPARGGVFDPA